MPFSFYSPIETNFINQKIDNLSLFTPDLIDRVRSTFSDKETLDSIDPIIVCIIDIAIEKIMGSVHLLSLDLQGRIKDKLKALSVVNSVTSYLESNDVFNEFKDEMLKELQELSFPEATSRLKEIENIFDSYDF